MSAAAAVGFAAAHGFLTVRAAIDAARAGTATPAQQNLLVGFIEALSGP